MKTKAEVKLNYLLIGEHRDLLEGQAEHVTQQRVNKTKQNKANSKNPEDTERFQPVIRTGNHRQVSQGFY